MRELVARPEAARTQNHATPNHGIIVFTVSLFIYPGVQRWATRASWQFLFPAFKAMRTGCCSPPPHFDISEKVPRPPGAAPPLPPLVDFRPSVRPSVQFRSSSSSPRWPFHSWRSSSHFAVTTSEFRPSSVVRRRRRNTSRSVRPKWTFRFPSRSHSAPPFPSPSLGMREFYSRCAAALWWHRCVTFLRSLGRDSWSKNARERERKERSKDRFHNSTVRSTQAS